jgi:ABC-type multidrug transport system fused ATPase/permease subunit
MSMKVYQWYFVRFSSFYLVAMLVFALGGSVAQAASMYVLDDWSKAQITSLFTTGAQLGMEDNLYYIGRYAWLNSIMVGSVYVTINAMVRGNCLFALKSHRELLASVLAAPIGWFDTTPLGRIMNRFSNDVSTIDNDVPLSLVVFFLCVVTILNTMVVIAVTFSQLGQMAKGGRRLLPGALGLCAIPTLAVLCGCIVSMTANARAGLAAGAAAFLLLAAVRAWESRARAA